MPVSINKQHALAFINHCRLYKYSTKDALALFNNATFEGRVNRGAVRRIVMPIIYNLDDEYLETERAECVAAMEIELFKNMDERIKATLVDAYNNRQRYRRIKQERINLRVRKLFKEWGFDEHSKSIGQIALLIASESK